MQVFAVMKRVGIRMNQCLETERKPEIRYGHAGAGEIMRRNSDDGKRHVIEPNGFTQHCGIAGKSFLPVVLADENRRPSRQFGSSDGFKAASAQWRYPEHRKVVFRNKEGAGELSVARGRRQQPQSSEQRASSGGAFADDPARVRERE